LLSFFDDSGSKALKASIQTKKNGALGTRIPEGSWVPAKERMKRKMKRRKGYCTDLSKILMVLSDTI